MGDSVLRGSEGVGPGGTVERAWLLKSDVLGYNPSCTNPVPGTLSDDAFDPHSGPMRLTFSHPPPAPAHMTEEKSEVQRTYADCPKSGS